MPDAGCPVPTRSGRICRIIRPDIRQNEKSGRMIWLDIRQNEKSGRIIQHCRISGPTLIEIVTGHFLRCPIELANHELHRKCC